MNDVQDRPESNEPEKAKLAPAFKLTAVDEAAFGELVADLDDAADIEFFIEGNFLVIPVYGVMFDMDHLLAVTEDLQGFAQLTSTRGVEVRLPIQATDLTNYISDLHEKHKAEEKAANTAPAFPGFPQYPATIR